MKYDVFISKNSVDQDYADSVVSCLESSGLTVFESKKDLPYLKDTDYSKAIFDALNKSENLIVLCSFHENGAQSRWVYDEWSWFINEVRSNRRNGQIMTIRKGISVGMLDPQLRKYESFDYLSYQNSIIPYLGKGRIISSKDPASSFLCYDDFFPLGDFVLGRTTLTDLARKGYIIRPLCWHQGTDLKYEGKSCLVYDNKDNGIIREMLFWGSKEGNIFPERWIKLGFNETLTIDEWRSLFISYGFTISDDSSDGVPRIYATSFDKKLTFQPIIDKEMVALSSYPMKQNNGKDRNNIMYDLIVYYDGD